MKEKLFCIGMLSIVSLFTGCSSNSSCKMVNQMIFDLNSVTEITIAYDEENISFYEGSNNELRIEDIYAPAQKKILRRSKREKKQHSYQRGQQTLFSGDFERYVKGLSAVRIQCKSECIYYKRRNQLFRYFYSVRIFVC